MKIGEIRERFDVPAFRRGYVTPNPGQPMAGVTGKIVNTTKAGHLVVRNLGCRELWRNEYHPHNLTYLDSAKVRARGFT